MKGLAEPAGDLFPEVRARVSASVCLITVGGVSMSDVDSLSPSWPDGIEGLRRLGIECRFAYAPVDEEPAGAISILTGQLPSTHAVHELGERLRPGTVTLAHALRANGMRTAAFSNVPIFSPRERSIAGEAFDEGHLVEADEPEDVAYATGSWLRPGYFFLWVHYEMPPGSDGEAAAEAFDDLISAMTSRLTLARQLEGTFVIAAGTSPREPGQPVPLFFRVPTRHGAGATRIGPCSTLDVPMTLCQIFGRVGFVTGPGRSLVDGNKPLYGGGIFAGTAPYERTENGKTVLGVRGRTHAYEVGPDGRARLLELRDGAPPQPVPIRGAAQAVARPLAQRLSAIKASLDRP